MGKGRTGELLQGWNSSSHAPVVQAGHRSSCYVGDVQLKGQPSLAARPSPITSGTPSSSQACSLGLATVAVVTANVGCTRGGWAHGNHLETLEPPLSQLQTFMQTQGAKAGPN